MRRGVEKQFWFTPEEDAEFRRKVALTGLPQTTLIKMLVKGYLPKERPDDRYYEAMNKLYEMINTAQELLNRSYHLGVIEKEIVEKQVKQWTNFILDIEHRFLKPDKNPVKWK